ncbi:hypothetical protein [Domibacillus aminovorans]|nr:hypothetical protein [Domibacillus aminovorans]
MSNPIALSNTMITSQGMDIAIQQKKTDDEPIRKSVVKKVKRVTIEEQ